MREALEIESAIADLVNNFVDKHDIIFIARGAHYPVAMKGALKVKKVSYTHAEAYTAGDLNHGPLGLIDDDMPVVTFVPIDELIDKLKSNLQEVHARGGQHFQFCLQKF